MPDAVLIAVAVPVAMALMLFLAIRGSRQVRIRAQMLLLSGQHLKGGETNRMAAASRKSIAALRGRTWQRLSRTG
jgi:hypothetical protein